MSPRLAFTRSSLTLLVSLLDLCTAQQSSQLHFSATSSGLKPISPSSTSSLQTVLTTPTTSTSSSRVLTVITSSLGNSSQYNPLAENEIECYPLPYGSIGFAGHVLNCYTIAMFALGRSPLIPWIRIRKDISRILLSCTAFLITIAISIMSTVRCNKFRSFELISIWQVFLSTTIFGLNISASYGPWANKGTFGDKRGTYILGISIFYLPGLIVGVIGARQLVWGHEQRVRYVEIALVGVLLVIAIVSYLAGGRSWLTMLVMTVISVIFVILPLYIDWALGILVQNIAGLPTSKNKILYWLFFAASRLPMLSI